MKRYWSSEKPQFKTAEERACWEAFDAQLTPEDITEMQTIDADCNDCRHFRRGAMRWVPGLTIFDGHCLQFDRPTRAYPMQFTGRGCFVHRKSLNASVLPVSP